MTQQTNRGTRSIQVRVMILVVCGVLTALLVPGWVAWQALDAVADRERDTLGGVAALAAHHVESVVVREWNKLQEIAAVAAAGAPAASPVADALSATLRSVYFRAELMERTYLTDAEGRVTAQEPTSASTTALLEVVREAAPVIASGRPGIAVADPGLAGSAAQLLVPVRDWHGTVVGVAGGTVRPGGAKLIRVLAPHTTQGQSAEIVDHDGIVMAASDTSRGTAHAHRRLIADRLRESASFAAPCRSCHRSEGQPGELLAAARVGAVPWAVVIRSAASAEAGRAARLRTTLLGLGPFLVGIGLLFAYGAAQSLLRPVRILTAESQRIADGSLDRPIPDLGRDELGRLGRSLEHMRVALKASIESVESANATLERRVEERTHELQALSRQLAEREEARARLLRQVITAQEDERKRLARELHDETCQTISALAMRLEGAAIRLSDGTVPPAVGEARALAVRALDELHRLIYDLRPSVLDDLGLWSAIRWYAERQLVPRGVSVRCEFPEGDQRLPPLFETALFRVAQEAISNIAKHAEADLVLIQGNVAGRLLTLEIEDDGKGFDAEVGRRPGPEGHGWGLLGITERVDALGGHVEIDTAPGQGVRLLVTVTLPSETDRG